MFKYKNKCFKLNKINLENLQTNPLRLRSSSAGLFFEQEKTPPAVNTQCQPIKPYEEIPTISIFTLIKNFLPGGKYYKLDSKEFFFALQKDFGSINIVKLPGLFGRPDVLYTHNIEDFEKIYRNEGTWPKRPGLLTLRYHRGVHRADFFQGVNGLLATIRHIRDPKSLEVPSNFEEEINRWTLESVSVVALDKQLGLINENRNDPKAQKMFTALTNFISLSLDVELKPSIWKYYKTPTFKKLMNSLDTLLEITNSYINSATERLELERRNGVPEKSENDKSVLEKLLKIDKKVATVMAMDMFLAGVDTSSTSFTGILLCLAKNPEKQAKLREEIRRILPHKNSEFTEEACKNMPYLRACIKESLRYYPVTVGNSRAPVKDLVVSGYTVPKGTRITMVSAALLRDENHFARPNEYLPERWLRNENETNQKQSSGVGFLKPSCPFVYLPFGFGPRTCIGRRIVEMELELGIARIVRNFYIEFNYPTKNAFKSVLINVPNIPLKFKFTDVES